MNESKDHVQYSDFDHFHVRKTEEACDVKFNLN